MVRKKLDNRIRTLIENGVSLGHRSSFLIVGDKGRDQVVILHHILSKATFKARPTVLWCYKKELGFTSHRKKRMKQIQKKIRSGKLSINEDDPFELFIASTEIRYCYYSETYKILGNTFGMCVLQDVHARYRTKGNQEIVGRFNERFILSLASCQAFIASDDELNILPLSSHILNIHPVTPKARDGPLSTLLNCCKTLDQGKVLLKLLDVITEKTLKATVSLTAARGRGKSAVLGLAIAGAVGFGYSNIFVTSPSPENLKTLFEFVLKGFDALEYQEHIDYELIQSSNPEFNNALVRLNIFRDHRQTVQSARFTGRTLHELTLEESIRYKPGDPVEAWLNQLLCLDSTSVTKLMSGFPSPNDCDLYEYYVNRDTLFCFHKASEAFLQRLVSIYVSAHYKNTPNDLQMISDAPAHHLFCLLGPVKSSQSALPEILCVVQVCLEGEISKQNVINSLSRGKRAAGDLIPWTIAQQFQDNDFPSLNGIRIVRIATHPDYQNMGYGSRVLQLLGDYYEGKISNLNEEDNELGQESIDHGRIYVEEVEEVGLLEEKVGPRRNLPPLLLRLSERKPEKLDYLGVSYGVTGNLLKFWKRNGFVPVYLRQTQNDLTGEHSCIMLKVFKTDTEHDIDRDWLKDYWWDFRQRLVSLLGYQFREFPVSMALSLLQNKTYKLTDEENRLTREALSIYLCNRDLRRLELYSQNMVDHHLITDLLPTVAKLYFTGKLAGIQLSVAQMAILLELDLPVNQLLALFNRSIKKIVQHLNQICESAIEHRLAETKVLPTAGTKQVVAQPTKISLEEDLREGAKEVMKQQQRDKKKLLETDFSEYSIKGSEYDWKSALSDSAVARGGIISVKSLMKKRSLLEEADEKYLQTEQKRVKKKKKKRDTL